LAFTEAVAVVEATSTPLPLSLSLSLLSSNFFELFIAVKFSVDLAFVAGEADRGRSLLRYPKKMLRNDRSGWNP